MVEFRRRDMAQVKFRRIPPPRYPEDELSAELVKCLYFAGLSVNEAADALGVSAATAYRHWAYARAWLRVELAETGKPGVTSE